MSPEMIAVLLLVIFTVGYFYWHYLFRKGLGHIRLGQYQEAVHQYDALLRFAPRHSMALNNRGYARECLDQHDEALQDYQRALQLNPVQ